MATQYTLRILTRVDGTPTEFDGQYVSYYDANGAGGPALLTTPDVTKAQLFESPLVARDYWMQIRGQLLRVDGKPDRPLTIFHCEIESFAGAVVCDFCGEPGPTCEYPAPDIAALQADDPAAVGPTLWSSTGGWLACEACAAFIDRSAWHELGARVFPILAARRPQLDNELYRQTVLAIWAAFGAARGPRQALEVAEHAG